MSGSDHSSQPAADPHEEAEARFSEHYDGTLSAGETAALKAHLDACATCRAAYEDFQKTVAALGGLHKMTAPSAFDKDVADTIRRRSGGRFFGRKAFGDRLPYELLAVLILVLGLVVFFLLRGSQTGSLRYEKAPKPPEIAPGAEKVVPHIDR